MLNPSPHGVGFEVAVVDGGAGVGAGRGRSRGVEIFLISFSRQRIGGDRGDDGGWRSSGRDDGGDRTSRIMANIAVVDARRWMPDGGDGGGLALADLEVVLLHVGLILIIFVVRVFV